MPRRKKRSVKVDWVQSPLIKERVDKLIQDLNLDWIDSNKIYCVESRGSSARAYARIWGMSRIWQVAANFPVVYCIEVVTEHFLKLPQHEQNKVLLHELAHIPKNFSGALLPHTHTKGGFHDKLHGMVAAYDKLYKIGFLGFLHR